METGLTHNPGRPIRVFIIDDHRMVREALERFFSGDPEIHAVGAIGTRDNLEAALAASQPHVVLLDPGLRRGLLPEMIRWLRGIALHVRIIVLALDYGQEMGALAVVSGADAFIDKERPAEELRDTILRVVRSSP